MYHRITVKFYKLTKLKSRITLLIGKDMKQLELLHTSSEIIHYTYLQTFGGQFCNIYGWRCASLMTQHVLLSVSCRAALSNTVATSQLWLFKFKIIKTKWKFSSLAAWAQFVGPMSTFQGLLYLIIQWYFYHCRNSVGQHWSIEILIHLHKTTCKVFTAALFVIQF